MTYVNDVANHRVLAFDSMGIYRAKYGHGGTDPDALLAASAIGLVANDSLLVVADWGRKALSAYEVTSGRLLLRTKLPGQDIGQNWIVWGDTVNFAVSLGSAMIGRWVIGDSVVKGIGKPPERLVHNIGIAIRYGRSDIAETDSGFVALLPTDSGVRLLSREGQEVGFVAIPAVRRLGEPKRLWEADPKRYQPSASSSDGIHRLSTGQFLVVHLDMDYVGTPPAGRFGNFRLYATILSKDLRKACVDTPIPLTTDIPPIPVFRGDSIVLLTRHVTADNVAVAIVRSYTIDPTGCEWLPLRQTSSNP